MKGLGLMLVLAAATVPGHRDPSAVLRVDFSNPGLTPAQWTLELHPDGSAHFHSNPGSKTAEEMHTIEPGTVDRNVQLSQEFADQAFQTVYRHKLFDQDCESHLKVAFQGWKKISYSGADGKGTCEFNYSRSKDIEELGEAFVGVASTIVEGARLEILLQHDPLGLDKEMEYMKEAAGDRRLREICAIQPILTKLADDPDVMERVRKSARTLLEEREK